MGTRWSNCTVACGPFMQFTPVICTPFARIFENASTIEPRQPHCVRAERVRLDHACAGCHVLAMDRADTLRIADGKLFQAGLHRQTLIEQERPHRSVSADYVFLKLFKQVHSVHARLTSGLSFVNGWLRCQKRPRSFQVWQNTRLIYAALSVCELESTCPRPWSDTFCRGDAPR